MPVRETPFFFGEKHPLFGILSETEGSSRKTAVLLLNSGLVHRAGPFRLGVQVSRALAAAGFPVLRVDQSARGDSERRKGVSVVEAADLDIEDAKKILRSRTGADKIILAGLCSGSDDVVRHASKTDDIDGLILMDPYSPKTRKYVIVHYLPRLLNPMRVLRFAGRKLGLSTSQDQQKENNAVDLGSFREFPDCPQARSAFRQVSEREGASLCLFTSGVAYYYNYTGQLISGLGIEDVSHSVEEVFFRTAEHTYPISAHRRRLVDTIVEFCSRRFE